MRKSQKITLGVAGLVAGAALLANLRQTKTDLAGQTVLVTGSSRGLGFLLAREFAHAGCQVVICARGKPALEQARVALQAQGANILAVPCDVADQAQVAHLVRQANQAFGQIDILVNNAGVIQVGPVLNDTLQDFEDAMNIMFWGVLHPTLAVLPQMVARRQGRIVNITSIGGKVSVPHLLPYVCAKFAATGLSEGLHAELAPYGITVTTVIPGLMRTGSHLNALFKGRQAEEFTWFSLGATLPFISMDAEQAAREIVAATQRGEAERILSLPAQALARFHGLFPGLTSELSYIIQTALLPATSPVDPGLARGQQVEAQLSPTRAQLLRILTTLGRNAAARFNQYAAL